MTTLPRPEEPTALGAPAPGRGTGMAHTVLNAVLFYGGWFACAFGLAYQWPLLGPLAALAVVGIHLGLRGFPRGEMQAIALVGVIGPGIETALVQLGVARFPEPLMLGFLAPLTLFALWAIFATTFDASLGWLGTRPWLAVAFAAIGAPLSYVAAERLGALELDTVVWRWALPVVVLWSFGFPALMRLASWARRLGSTALDPS